MRYLSKLIIAGCLATDFFSLVYASPAKLVFPASKVEPNIHRYQRVQKKPAQLDFNRIVDQQYLADTLLSLLKQPSKSCQEGSTTLKAKEILAAAGASLGILIEIDNLPERVAKMSEAKRARIACNKGTTMPQSGNLIARVPGNAPVPSWNLSFHLDTNQVTFDDFTIDGDLIKPAPDTPLGADDKAGIVIIAELLRIIAKQKIRHGEIYIVGLVAEEDTAAGAQLIDGEAFKGDIVVSIDGTDPNKIGRAAPTMYSGYITVKTETSHPASIDTKQSVSACAVGARILTEAGFTPSGHPPRHPDVVLHSYFTSCGVNREARTAKGEPVASYQYNTVSPLWTAAWQMRNLEGPESARKMANRIEATVKNVCAEAGKGRTPVKCEITGVKKPKLIGYTVKKEAASVRLLRKGFEQTSRDPVKVTAQQFGAFNGNFIKARFGEEMLIVGTGADQIHTNEETVSIKGMARVVKGVLAAMMESYRYQRIDSDRQ